MMPFRRLIAAARRTRRQKVVQEFQNQLFASPICSDYENVFPQVRPLVDEMVGVVPYGVTDRGTRLPLSKTRELALLYTPNETMGNVEFLDTMFSTWLTENQLYIHAHKNRAGRVEGYSILPPSTFNRVVNGQDYWRVTLDDGTIETYYDDEVMTLCYSRNPTNLTGVSPASAIRLYAQIDDLLAQFEKAYLENGAIPASVTIIRASTQEKYDEVRNELEHQLKGAKNRNKTLYLWRQFNNDDGTERDQVEVKTIQGNNNTLAIKEIVSVVNDRLNKAYGVSNFILGDDSSAKYDNAELSDYQFTRRRVKPALRKFWSEFQNELDRITGGLGYAIDFHLDMPELTDRRKVEAEISQKNVANLTNLITAGSKPVAACVALNLNVDKWQDVAAGIYSRVLADREQAHTSAAGPSLAVSETAEPETDTQTQTDTTAEEIQQTRDQQHHHHEHTDDYFQPFRDDEVVEKKIFEKLMSLARAIFAENPDIDLDAISTEIFEFLEDEANRGGTEALEAISLLIDEQTQKDLEELIRKGVDISDGLSQRIHERTEQIVQDYDRYTREIMRATLENSEGLTAKEIRERLESVLPNGRAATIARNETVYAFKSGRLELDERVAQEYNFTIDLEWRTSPEAGDVCPLCAAMEGEITHLGQAFQPKAVDWTTVNKNGEEVEHHSPGWEISSWNDYGRIPNAHVNCKCYFQEVNVRRAE